MTQNPPKDRLISSYISTPQGKKALADSMIQSFRRKRVYCKHHKEIKDCEETECMVEFIHEE